MRCVAGATSAWTAKGLKNSSISGLAILSGLHTKGQVKQMTGIHEKISRFAKWATLSYWFRTGIYGAISTFDLITQFTMPYSSKMRETEQIVSYCFSRDLRLEQSKRVQPKYNVHTWIFLKNKLLGG